MQNGTFFPIHLDGKELEYGHVTKANNKVFVRSLVSLIKKK